MSSHPNVLTVSGVRSLLGGPDLPQLLPRAAVLAAMHRFISEVGDAVQMGTTGDADVRLGPGGAGAVGPDNGIVRPVSVLVK